MNPQSETKQKATKRPSVLVDVRLIAEAPSHTRRYCRDKEHEARNLQEWVDEFREFIRDHRSQDPVQLDVERVTQDQCSECESEWETTIEDGVLKCASCGAEVEEMRHDA